MALSLVPSASSVPSAAISSTAQMSRLNAPSLIRAASGCNPSSVAKYAVAARAHTATLNVYSSIRLHATILHQQPSMNSEMYIKPANGSSNIFFLIQQSEGCLIKRCAHWQPDRWEGAVNIPDRKAHGYFLEDSRVWLKARTRSPCEDVCKGRSPDS